MPIAYTCDGCGASAGSLAGWFIVSVLFLHELAGVQPGGRTLDATAPDLLFHAVACRDAWCAAAGITAGPDPMPVSASG